MKHLPGINNIDLNDILVPSFDHKELEDDDCGLPENPISSNYSKYLWQGHTRNSRIRSLVRQRRNVDGDNLSK
ncbi:MAG TPA: hypothetical protein VGD31_17120 [Sphingobacteriaceae bacterium]